ncbi:NAD(P)-binding domain-containing protein [Pseudarthrobacter sp. NPDC058329]|uniref:NAD(P)-binding domain-containing protein n=1 Tax=Pseudarthrobacter sp. NPDC058329 TaxID=3346448 RepID=UPI0036DD1BAF
MNITIIGSGQVGLCWAQALDSNAAHTISLSDPQPPAAATSWSETSGVTILPKVSEWIADQDVVLVCVPGSVLPFVTDALVQHLRAGATIVDMTTAAANAKRESAASADAEGVGYIDIAITGAVALSGVRTPLLYGGKPNSAVEDLLAAVGAPVRVLPDSVPGDAVTVKLLRSVIMKGLEALAVEALPAARAYGVLDQLYTVLGDVDRAPFTDLLKSMVATHPAHSVRRHAEVLEAAAQLERAGYPAELTGHVAGRYSATAENLSRTGGPADGTFEASLEWLDTLALPAVVASAAEEVSA